MIRTENFELWRQDDNGHSFLVARFSNRRSAEKRMAEMTRCPHKQIYWIVEKSAGRATPAAESR